METVPQEEINTQPELTSPPSPKRARTDHAATEDLNGNSRFDSSQLGTPQETISSLSAHHLEKSGGPMTAECGQYHPRGLILDLTPDTHVTSELYEVCVSAERDEKSFVTETGELSPARNSTPSLPDWKQLEKSLENEAPGCRGVCLQNDGNHGTVAQTHPSLIQAVTFCSDQGADTDLCHAFSQLADAVEGDLRKAGRSSTSSSQDALPLCSNAEGDLSQKSDLHIHENLCDVETKGQRSKTFVECSEGSICYEFVSGTSISAENVSFEKRNHVGAAEIPAAARISQEAAEGDNKADAFGVIDPVIWSETDNSDGAAGGELSPLVKVCKLEATPPLCSEVRMSPDSSPDQTEKLQDQKRTSESRDGNKIRTPSNETQDQTDNEAKSSLAKPPPAGDDGTEDTAQSPSSCSAVSPDHMETAETEYSHSKTDGGEHVAGIKQTHPPKETETDELRKLEKAIKSELENKPGHCYHREGEGETQKHGSKFKCIDGEQENELLETFTGVTAEGGEKNQEVKAVKDVQMESELKEDVREESPSGDVSEWVENRLSFYNGEDPEQRLACLAHDQHTPDVSTLCAVPPTTDAVVPCRSQNALHGLGYFPSAFTPCDDVLGGFDSFEKIKLLPEDDDDTDARALLNTPQEEREQQVQMAESKINEKTLVDEKENMENRFVSSDSSCNEVPNFIPQSEREPNSGSACDSSQRSHDGLNPQPASSAGPTDCDGSSSDLSTSFDFEMKEQFSRVLQELSLFFDISRSEFTSDCRPSSPDLPESLEEHTSISPGLSTDKAVEDHSLVMCGVDLAVSCPVIRSDGEQEVPLNRNLGQEPSMDTAEKNKESHEAEQKVRSWSPSFMRLPDLEQLRHRPPELPTRLEPLRTCARPIRVGLSKRAKTKQLHHVHPYK